MLERIIPDDRRQAVRVQRVLLASVAYLMWMGLAAFMYAMGLLRITGSQLSLYFLAIVVVNVVFLTLVRSNLNRRFSDPSMTFAQIAVSIVIGMTFIAAIVPGARAAALLLFISCLFFGIFRLHTRQFVTLAFLASGLYGALILWDALHSKTHRLELELVQLVVLATVLLWLSFMGSYVARLRAELRRAMQRIESLANTDHLTGTENRRSISTHLRDAVDVAGSDGERTSICLLDIDHFKSVNDRFGHPVGDEVLQRFAERIRGKLRDSDRVEQRTAAGTIGRFGGEEFLVVLRNTDETHAVRVAGRIRDAVTGEPFPTRAGAVRITVSVGVATGTASETDVGLLRRADRALYRAKHGGRDRVCLSEAGDGAPSGTPAV